MKDFDRKIHYKMYKAHRGWLVAGITVTSMAVGIIAGPQTMQTAQADDSGTPVTETEGTNASSAPQQVALQSTKPAGDVSAQNETDNKKDSISQPQSGPNADDNQVSGDQTSNGSIKNLV